MQNIEQINNFSIVKTEYESTMRQFYHELEEKRNARVKETGDNHFTKEEALLPWLVSFLLPDSSCRAVMEYDPTADRVKFYREEFPQSLRDTQAES